MSEFTKYEKMRAEGASAPQVYAAANADGVDAIASIRLLREAFGLTLGEVKQLTGAGDVWSKTQSVAPGLTVYWEGWDNENGVYLMQGEVEGIEGDYAVLKNQKKYLLVKNGIEETPIKGPHLDRQRVSLLQLPLSNRIEQLLTMLDKVAESSRKNENKKKVVGF